MMIRMIQLENLGDGRLRFATKYPSTVELITVDGKIFVHSERLVAKTSNVAPPTAVRPETELKEAK